MTTTAIAAPDDGQPTKGSRRIVFTLHERDFTPISLAASAQGLKPHEFCRSASLRTARACNDKAT